MQETFYHLPVPLTIALLADLHDRPYHAIEASLRARKPDMICIAGDFIHGGFPLSGLKMEECEYALRFLASCASIAPTYVSLGNHEWLLSDDDLACIRSKGVCVLDNSYVKAQGVALGGLSSARFTGYQHYRKGFLSERYPRPYKSDSRTLQPDVAWLDEFESLPEYKILLSHHPEYYEPYLAGRKIDLILSGHAHGGQIRLFSHGLFAPGQGFLPEYTAGIHRNLVITRGLSNPAVIPRLFNPVEIVYITKKK